MPLPFVRLMCLIDSSCSSKRSLLANVERLLLVDWNTPSHHMSHKGGPCEGKKNVESRNKVLGSPVPPFANAELNSTALATLSKRGRA